jgi:hypothetical protein
MKAPRSLLFLGLLLAISAWARADVIPYGATFETCKGAEGETCTMEGGFKGKCAWLTGEERRAIGVRARKAHCESEGVHAGRCLTCVSEAYRAAGPSKSPAGAGAKPSEPVKPGKTQ